MHALCHLARAVLGNDVVEILIDGNAELLLRSVVHLPCGTVAYRGWSIIIISNCVSAHKKVPDTVDLCLPFSRTLISYVGDVKKMWKQTVRFHICFFETRVLLD